VGFFLFVILVAVGEDYNILLMARVIEEEERHGITEGTRLAVAHTGGIISSCGLIMAGTFGSMLTGTLTSLRELGFALGLGILLDTFLVRPVLVPAFVVVMDRVRAARRAEQLARKAAAAEKPDVNPKLFAEASDQEESDSRLRPEAIDSCLGQFYDES
ncbi:MAG: MMPL family transporter, partial [Isosphaeraceae bacterium]